MYQAPLESAFEDNYSMFGSYEFPLFTPRLHLVFIAGYAMMALAVGLHVSLAHGPKPEEARSFRPSVLIFGLLILAAAGMRALVDFDPERFFFWLGCAAAAFLAATLIWAAIALPRAWHRD